MATVTLEIEFQEDENSFHTTYSVEKYKDYARRFEKAARDALGCEGIDHDIRFNPGPPRGYQVYPAAPWAPMKGWYTKDKAKVRYPRLGAFEVVLKAPSRYPLPETSLVWSKLRAKRWPNPKELAECVARALSSGDAELLQRIESKCAGHESSTADTLGASTSMNRSRQPSPHPPMFFGTHPRNGIASPTEVRSASSGAPIRARRPLSAVGARDKLAAGSSVRSSSRPGSAKSAPDTERKSKRPPPPPLSSPTASTSSPPAAARGAWAEKSQEPPAREHERTLAPGETLAAAAAAEDAGGQADAAPEVAPAAAVAAEVAAKVAVADPADASNAEFEESFEASGVVGEPGATAAKEVTASTRASESPDPAANGTGTGTGIGILTGTGTALTSPGGDTTAARLRKGKSIGDYDDFEEDFEEEEVEVPAPPAVPSAAPAAKPAAAPTEVSPAAVLTPDPSELQVTEAAPPAQAPAPTPAAAPVDEPTPAPTLVPAAAAAHAAAPAEKPAVASPPLAPVPAPTPAAIPVALVPTSASASAPAPAPAPAPVADYDDDDFENTLEEEGLPAATTPVATPAAATHAEIAVPDLAPVQAPSVAASRRGNDAYSDDGFDEEEAESPSKPVAAASPAKPSPMGKNSDGSGSSATRASTDKPSAGASDGEEYEDEGFETDEPPTSPQANLKPEDHTKDSIVVDGHSFDYVEDEFEDGSEASVDVSVEDKGSVKSVDD